MNAKRILNFLVLRSAMSSRNFTSLLLVALFFGVYVAAGGKIAPVPSVQGEKAAAFGDVSTGAKKATTSRARMRQLSGDIQTQAPQAAEPRKQTTKTRTTRPQTGATPSDSIASDLSAIEERLNRLKSGG